LPPDEVLGAAVNDVSVALPLALIANCCATGAFGPFCRKNSESGRTTNSGESASATAPTLNTATHSHRDFLEIDIRVPLPTSILVPARSVPDFEI
jgi:hypothetical protein